MLGGGGRGQNGNDKNRPIGVRMVKPLLALESARSLPGIPE